MLLDFQHNEVFSANHLQSNQICKIPTTPIQVNMATTTPETTQDTMSTQPMPTPPTTPTALAPTNPTAEPTSSTAKPTTTITSTPPTRAQAIEYDDYIAWEEDTQVPIISEHTAELLATLNRVRSKFGCTSNCVCPTCTLYRSLTSEELEDVVVEQPEQQEAEMVEVPLGDPVVVKDGEGETGKGWAEMLAGWGSVFWCCAGGRV
ncbi:uncharacterized protein K452DRAFT_111318 [Aplosporella prunicola CBS 121167]|uniref:Uncharacterized protein n=1 Tax=Aplosporella prunicola CBS 121167 TaxID=1176127 RepID=A0A6A6B2P7_9PEZI|nr:uncharacterized protein K452DRAFT_111318 [Aplosporella prunicola CBS 121167]KAF2137287.1 hypothetical protein K452DRAFT_111318 [Aplosporella prunicola CBS 121167]